MVRAGVPVNKPSAGQAGEKIGDEAPDGGVMHEVMGEQTVGLGRIGAGKSTAISIQQGALYEEARGQRRAL